MERKRGLEREDEAGLNLSLKYHCFHTKLI